ncbi:hypothetical protein T11_18612 [Trichinella zimbabwensis]|uniref:Uncharacterized protein n=1 Tax=Trichinella zimbabwensis TaxID=268475 RepID=A0A0V1GCN2_9BILA|nr:hypothetical protein T11_18612 [Trichinella zimbabwensis]
MDIKPVAILQCLSARKILSNSRIRKPFVIPF